MATESLIVELDARTAKLDAKLKATQTQLDGLDGKVKKSDKSFSSFTKSALGVATAVTAMAASIGVAINQAGKFAVELDVAANRAGESVESMQSLAFAANTVGVSLEKIGDISKDTNEKVGEFLSTGGGGFQDFADVMGLTAIQARDAASEFERMSGPDVLQEMVNRMEEAGVSANQMSFALEGMASDTTDLLPLLRDGGEGLKGLREEFDELNISLSSADVERIKEVSKELDKATSIFDTESKQLIADYSDELINAINVTVTIAQKTTDFFNVVTTGFGNMIELAGAALTDFVNGTDTFNDMLAERTAESASVLNELLGEDFFDAGVNAGSSLVDGVEEGIKPLEIIITKGGKTLTDWEKLNSKQRLDVQSKYIKAASILSNSFLEENKAINAGLIVADTAAGVMKAFATSSNIYEAFANAAVVAATGIAQLNNVLSASKGGGTISGGSGGASASQEPVQQNFEPETTDLDTTITTGENVQRLVISLEDGTDLIDGIASVLDENNRQGR